MDGAEFDRVGFDGAGSEGAGFDEAWAGAPAAVRRCLELAHQSLAGGGLAVGAVLVDGAGQVRAEGRNRAYDGPGGPDPLQGTPLAHAELNALAQVRTGCDLGRLTLWSTQQPCAMCRAAAEFTGVGAVRHLAPDPWALAAERGGPGPAGASDEWLVAANLLFLQSVLDSADAEHPTVRRNRELEPETSALLLPGRPPGAGAAELLRPLWPALGRAAAARRARLAAG
ncbi:nucleoside deaminase [Kitasatospora viridis]|uniref:tRNA(Arg) A34 adenosine deaminase TadA n=1 Tax=Kitasatospora viridis TaxID=281105 RepID=A0A561UPV5_9ACTN|nr:nucleoside deaminase [Kitasatospora viridis]TWG01407.1 tRNA(Arg) A34 adenosine deaminase TadA [Kitasatospora viridis]